MSTILCKHCGSPASFFSKANEPQCQKSSNSCPAVKQKNSDKLKQRHLEAKQNGEPWRILTEEAKAKQGWSKGLTADTNSSVKAMTMALTGRRRLSDEQEIHKRIYYEACSFNLLECLSRVKGYELLKKHGMYSRLKNPNGVVRDHRLSLSYGFKNKVSVDVMSHPANCEFIQHSVNAKKSSKSSITLEQLLEEIESWK